MPARILIIDDDEDIRESVSQLLEVEGYSVRGLGDGASVLAELKAGEYVPQCILLDQLMPRMSGDEVRVAIQGGSRWATVPIIFCSGDVVSDDARQAVFAVLEKPFDLDRLFEVIRAAIGAA
jgi:CheY-like chemotaxis protein